MSPAASGNPYIDAHNGVYVTRTFDPDVDDAELVWHRDLESRKVTIVESNGWAYQLDNALPVDLKVNDTVYIPKLIWHRLVKGSGRLVINIEVIPTD